MTKRNIIIFAVVLAVLLVLGYFDWFGVLG
jgi:outer membrane murein-binding lipoprotein Lpp